MSSSSSFPSTSRTSFFGRIPTFRLFGSRPAQSNGEAGSAPSGIFPRSDSQLAGTLFHEHWWLDAATGGRFEEVTVESGGRVIGRLPFVITKRRGFTVSRLPPFTHVLGPVVDAGAGKPQTQLLRRLSVIRELLDKLPSSLDYFFQALDSSVVDGLAFQDRGFHVSPQYTFEIDCRDDVEALWAAMHFKTRQHIRRAEEKFEVSAVEDPDEFICFYLDNLRKSGLKSEFNWATFPEVFRQSKTRDCGELLCARWPDGRPTAMVYLVWGHGKMYYLMSTRAKDAADNGSINLLIWTAMKRAHERGLFFDLDGVSTSGTARFLCGFNGSPKMRMIVRRACFAFGAVQYAKRQFFGMRSRDTSRFT